VPARVVIAEDSYLVREGLTELLGSDPEIELVAVARDAAELVAAVERERPDVVLTDVRMPPDLEREGIRVAGELRETHPEIGVVVLSQYAEASYALELLEGGSGGRAYLLKERVGDRAEIGAAIRAVAQGGSVIDAKIVDALIAERARAADSRLGDLTARENEVLAEVAAGKSNAAIAEELFLTKRAVEKHINAIFLKLNLRESEDVSRRVKATLIFLSEEGRPVPPPAP
jgi:DNA-binding NarL/FixJ family response regulator